MIDALVLKSTLESGNYTCVLSNGVDTFTSNERGVKPLVAFIDGGKNFRGFAAADKVVGKGAALLYAYMGISSLYASIISEPALETCRANGIFARYGTLVKNIINRRSDGICPMETLTENIDDPAIAVAVIRDKLKSMR